MPSWYICMSFIVFYNPRITYTNLLTLWCSLYNVTYFYYQLTFIFVLSTFEFNDYVIYTLLLTILPISTKRIITYHLHSLTTYAVGNPRSRLGQAKTWLGVILSAYFSKDFCFMFFCFFCFCFCFCFLFFCLFVVVVVFLFLFLLWITHQFDYILKVEKKFII